MKGIVDYYVNNGSYVWEQFVRHFLISLYGILFASLIAIPLGFYLSKHRKLAPWIIRVASMLQTIPSIAMLSILMAILGLGVNTVIVAVFLYSLLPILNNTYTAILSIEASHLDVAKAMGMTPVQIIWKVELPLSLSLILGGIRNAIVLGVGITSVGTFIGAGGMGEIISRGLNMSNGSAVVWAGALPTAFMAILMDIGLGFFERKLRK